jgi:hypothetical protein
MVKRPGPDKSTEPLKAEIGRSRDRIERELRGLRFELDFPARIRRSFQQKTGVWIAAAAVLGTILVVLPRRNKKVYVDVPGEHKPKSKLLEAGFLLGALRIAMMVFRPAIARFITKKMSSPTRGAPSERKW